MNIFNTSFDKKLCSFRFDTLSHIPAKTFHRARRHAVCAVSACPAEGEGRRRGRAPPYAAACVSRQKRAAGLVAEPYVASVVKRRVSVHHPFRCPVPVYQQRVVGDEPRQRLLALCEVFFYEWIAVACQYYHGLSGRHGDHPDLVHGYGEAVDYGVVTVLARACRDEVGQDVAPSGVVCAQTFCFPLQFRCIPALLQLVPYEVRTPGGDDFLVGLGIVMISPADNAVAVAHEPHLPAPAAVDGGTCRGARRRLRQQPGGIRTACGAGFVHGSRHALAEVLHAGLFWHRGDKPPYGLHAQPPVAHVAVDARGGLAGAAVYHGDEAIACRYPVFALLRGAFSYGRSLYDFHCMVVLA